MDMKSNSTHRNADDSRSVDVSRRKFLAASAVGVAGLGAIGSAAAAPDEHTLVITGTGSSTSYSFTVGGNLEKSTAGGASIDSSDEIVGNSAHGGVGSGTDAYTFTGPLYSFDFDQSGAIDVDLDGEPARVGQRPDHTLLIEGTGENAEYSFATESRPSVSRAYGASINSSDERSYYGAGGSVQGGKDAYKYDGELRAFDLDGEARVTIDGKAAYVGQRPDQRMIISLEKPSQDAEYEITVGGSIRDVTHDDQGGDGEGAYTIDGNTISGSIWGASYDEFTFDGEILSIESNNTDALEIISNYEKIL